MFNEDEIREEDKNNNLVNNEEINDINEPIIFDEDKDEDNKQKKING